MNVQGDANRRAFVQKTLDSLRTHVACLTKAAALRATSVCDWLLKPSIAAFVVPQM